MPHSPVPVPEFLRADADVCFSVTPQPVLQGGQGHLPTAVIALGCPRDGPYQRVALGCRLRPPIPWWWGAACPFLPPSVSQHGVLGISGVLGPMVLPPELTSAFPPPSQTHQPNPAKLG